jgi:hypothetical protein
VLIARAIPPALPVHTAVGEAPTANVSTIVALNVVATAPVSTVAGLVRRLGIPDPPAIGGDTRLRAIAPAEPTNVAVGAEPTAPVVAQVAVKSTATAPVSTVAGVVVRLGIPLPPPRGGDTRLRAIPPAEPTNVAVGAEPTAPVVAQVALRGTGFAVVVPVAGVVDRPETPEPPVNVEPPTTSLLTLRTPPFNEPADILYT